MKRKKLTAEEMRLIGNEQGNEDYAHSVKYRQAPLIPALIEKLKDLVYAGYIERESGEITPQSHAAAQRATHRTPLKLWGKTPFVLIHAMKK